MNKILNTKLIYYVLLVSGITGAWTALPMNKKIYAFHIGIVIYTVHMFIKITKNFKYKFKVSECKIKNYIIFFAIWYFYIIATYFWAESVGDYFMYLILYTLVFYYVFILVINNNDIESLKKTIYLLGICFTFSLIIGLLEAKTNFRLWGSPYVRRDFAGYNNTAYSFLMQQPTAFFHNPNNFATFILFGISFLMSFILYSKNNMIYYLLLILSFIVLFLSNSRANMIGVFLVLIVFSFLRLRTNKKLQTYLAIILISAVLILIVVSSPTLLKITSEGFKDMIISIKMLIKFDFTKSSSGSSRFREILIRDSLYIIKNNPFGVGTGNTSYHLGVMQGTSNLNLHNWFLELCVDFGIPFFISYIGLYISIMKGLYRCMTSKNTDNDFKIIAAGCFFSHIGFIIGMVSPSGIVYFLPYWILIGISLSVINIDIRISNKADN